MQVVVIACSAVRRQSPGEKVAAGSGFLGIFVGNDHERQLAAGIDCQIGPVVCRQGVFWPGEHDLVRAGSELAVKDYVAVLAADHADGLTG